MVNSELFELFPKHFIDKQLEITYSGGTITNSELFSESMELTESLCSESELRFGACEASQIKFKIANMFIPMFNQEITVQMKLEEHHNAPFQLGKYKVVSDTPTADRRWRDIVAYDAMYDILNADVAAWYNETLPDMESSMTMRDFRKKFLAHFGVEEANPEQELVNDSMTVQRTVDPAEMSGKDVITAICEINACFGHINREGRFTYIYLPQLIQGLYPANDLYPDHAPDYLPYQKDTGHLYPQNPKGMNIGKNGTYISCKYEDYVTKNIQRLQIRKEDDDIGVIINDIITGNTYIIQDNFLVYGKGTEELKPIAEHIFSKIIGIVYRPYDAELQGNPCYEVGDAIKLNTKYEIIESYILQRTLKGIQSLKDSFSASGTEFYLENLNSTHNSIIELRRKSNVLTRTIEETKSELRDTEKDLRSTITQTASEIRSEVEKADGELSSTITQTADQIRQEIKNGDDQLSSSITQTASEIRGEVNDVKNDLQSEISINTESINQRVKNSDFEAFQKITAHSIELQVSDNKTSAGISIQLKNANGDIVSSESGTITLSGLVTFDNLSTKGSTTINGDNITTGTINCDLLNGGTIQGQRIEGGTFYMPKYGPGMRLAIDNTGQLFLNKWQYALTSEGAPDYTQWIPWTYNGGVATTPYGVCHIYGVPNYLIVVFEADQTGKRWYCRIPYESYEYLETNEIISYPVE